jgi:Ca2+-binding RTX toxin-like protein
LKEAVVWRTLTLAVTLALFAAPSAYAGVATTADGNLRYTAGAGELNNVSFSRTGTNSFKVVDVGAVVTAGQGCTQDTPNQATCTTANGRPIIANLADQNDRAVSRTSRSVQFFGEGGNDRLAGASGRDTVDGGDGDDILTGGSGRDTIRGGPGNDQLFGNSGNDSLSGADGTDLLDGGAGNDGENGGAGNDSLRQGNAPNGSDALSGGDGIDTIDYTLRPAPVRIDLNGLADDGDIRSGEADNVSNSVDVMMGGAASDQMLGRENAADTMIGGTGDDYMDGRRGPDRIDGGPGIDQIAARDLSSDTISCGDSIDSVAADERDAVGADCERNRRTASMSLALEGHAIFPTLMFKVRCPTTAFKYCAGKIVIATPGKVTTRSGKRTLTVAVKRFLVAQGSERLVGVRIRGATAPFIKRGGLVVRARLSGFDGAGPARPDAVRFTLKRH